MEPEDDGTPLKHAITWLQLSLRWQKLHHTARRTLLLVCRLRASAAEGAPMSKKKRATPEDIVRLYDSVLDTLADMAQLELYKEHELLMGKLSARSAGAKAFRCYFVAESFAGAKRFREAHVLYGRARNLLGEATALHAEYAAPHAGPESEGCAPGPGEDADALAELGTMIEGAQIRASAHAIIAEVGDGEEAEKRAKAAQTAPAGTPLLERLDMFYSETPEFLIDFPPKLEAVPCKPLLFDMARNEIHPPDLSERISKKSSTWGSWFGRG